MRTSTKRNAIMLMLQRAERLSRGGASSAGRCDSSAGARSRMHSLQLSPAVLQGLSRLANPQDSSWPVAKGPESAGQKSTGGRLAVLVAYSLLTGVKTCWLATV